MKTTTIRRTLPVFALFLFGFLIPHSPSKIYCSLSTIDLKAPPPSAENPPHPPKDQPIALLSNSQQRMLPEDSNDPSDDYGAYDRASLPPHKRYDRLISSAADEFDVDFYLIKGLIQAESSFDPTAVSSEGASGLMQIMPGTADMLGVQDRFDPQQNIYAGVRYLKFLIEALDGDIRLALAAYNAGITRVRQWGGVPPYKVTKRYIKQVFRYAKEFRSL
ncbi:MAG: lytic transglycosylase domain-containing protein [Deltaproteobacteria bacterium]|nr:lytic transglycosylase domain-containing protein [Deltaproteobacteria bacterium]